MIVVGGGPSAPESYDWIKASDMDVVCASTMLLPLQAAGIEPDVVCAIDPSSIMTMHFRGVRSNATLVYHRGIVPQIPRDWHGQKRAVENLPGSSVIHLCVMEAIRWQPDEVVLIGVDFCYPGMESHAEGVVTSYPLDPRVLLMRENGYGLKVSTDITMLDYRAELEHIVADHDEVRWLRRGRSGLPIAGVEWM